jgi:hypothetical protein
MEFENEVHVAWSPGARVVVGSPMLPLFGAVIVGFVLGAAIAMLAQRHRNARGRPCLGDAARRQVDVCPTGESVVPIPVLTMPEQDQLVLPAMCDRLPRRTVLTSHVSISSQPAGVNSGCGE